MTGTQAHETGDDWQDLRAPGSPAWWAARQGREEPSRRPPITLDRIVAGALAFIDREGLAALSMRNLAAELQTGTTTLYRYVAGKDEVLVLVADAVLGEAQLLRPVDGLGWRGVLEELARSMRRVLSAHPSVATLLATAIPVGPNSLRARELALGVLRERGFDQALAADVYTALAHQVFASVLQESTDDFRTGGLGASKSLTLRDFYRSLPPEQFPQLVELADALTSRTGTEEFEFGLQCFLDGVELRLRRAAEPEN
ncbi:TetR/AcrR family transcriptional regulator [Streptomyces sp. NPDC058470]|uniref:TetR/AcrR family transcriptional regulator n=1 Tax=Streptomyces sp. NPDC058470 TaxID=3346515 RepID=UPI003664DAAF